jgi:hypothetical protein
MKTALVVALMLASGVADADDLCAGTIPTSLATSLTKTFPRYRLPISADSPADSIEYNLKNGGSGCLSVASADFDGDGNADYIIGLTARAGYDALVVAALARPSNWNLHHTLSIWPYGRARLYVATDKAGTYRRTEALSGALERDEVDPLNCPNSVAIYGGIESSGVAFCFDGQVWKHVWISD